MKVSAKGNVLTINTGISLESYRRFNNHGALTVEDADNNEVYKVSHSYNNRGNITKFNIQTNSVLNGKLALTIILPTEFKVADAIEDMTPALLALQANEEIILTQLTALEASYSRILSDIEIEE